jgi:hypothetical protein
MKEGKEANEEGRENNKEKKNEENISSLKLELFFCQNLEAYVTFIFMETAVKVLSKLLQILTIW